MEPAQQYKLHVELHWKQVQMQSTNKKHNFWKCKEYSTTTAGHNAHIKQLFFTEVCRNSGSSARRNELLAWNLLRGGVGHLQTVHPCCDKSVWNLVDGVHVIEGSQKWDQLHSNPPVIEYSLHFMQCDSIVHRRNTCSGVVSLLTLSNTHWVHHHSLQEFDENSSYSQTFELQMWVRW